MIGRMMPAKYAFLLFCVYILRVEFDHLYNSCDKKDTIY